MTGIVCALCCLVLAALNDFVFKLFAGGSHSRGLFVAIIGVVWLLALLALPVSPDTNWHTTLLWGTISGIFSAGGNILLIEAMSKESVGLCSLIYRLNMVPVVIGAAILFGEEPSGPQYFGIGFAVAAVLLFQLGLNDKFSLRRIAGAGLWMVILASLMRAGMGLSYKYAFLHGADKNAVAQLNSLFWIAGGVVYALVRERKNLSLDRKLLGIGALSGVLVAGIVLFMAWSLAYGDASVVLPIAQMSFVLTFILGVVFLHEKFYRRQLFAMAFGIAAVIWLAVG